jgi:hypothetical protein
VIPWLSTSVQHLRVPTKRAATVWLAIAKKVETVAITRGENRGRELSYHQAITLWLPLGELKTRGGDYLMVLLQVEGAGPILGAAEIDQL